jgi:hypothetical protein
MRHEAGLLALAVTAAVSMATYGCGASPQVAHFSLRMRPVPPLSAKACIAEARHYGYSSGAGSVICAPALQRGWYHAVLTNRGAYGRPRCVATELGAQGQKVLAGPLSFEIGGIRGDVRARAPVGHVLLVLARPDTRPHCSLCSKLHPGDYPRGVTLQQKIAVPSAPGRAGLSRSLMAKQQRRSRGMTAPSGPIPRLTARVAVHRSAASFKEDQPGTLAQLEPIRTAPSCTATADPHQLERLRRECERRDAGNLQGLHQRTFMVVQLAPPRTA